MAQIESSDRDDVPGPGSYEIAEQYKAIGKQILSQKRNAPSLSFEQSAPTGRDPIYSGDHRKDTLISPHKFGAKPFNKTGIFTQSKMLKAPKSVVESGKGSSFIKDTRHTVPIEEPQLLSKGFLEMIRGKDAPGPDYNVTWFPDAKNRRQNLSKKRANAKSLKVAKRSTFGSSANGRNSYIQKNVQRKMEGKMTLSERLAEHKKKFQVRYDKIRRQRGKTKPKLKYDQQTLVPAIGYQPSSRKKNAPNFTFSNVPREDIKFYTPDCDIKNRKEKYPHIPTH